MKDNDAAYFQFLFLSGDHSRLVQVPEGLTKKNHSDCWSCLFPQLMYELGQFLQGIRQIRY